MNDTNLNAVMSRLDAMQAQMNYLVERQKKQEELIDEMVMPIAKEALKSLTGDFAELEKKGYFAFGKELVKVGQRIVESYSVDDVRALGESITTILDTVRAVTQPEVLTIAGEATEVLQNVEKTEPIGLVGMVRATRNEDVGRGIAVMLEVLKKVGKGAAVVSSKQQKDLSKRDKVNALLAPKRKAQKVLGVERRIVAKPGNGHAAVAQLPPNACAVPAKPQPVAAVIDGVAFTADGHLADPAQWTRSLGENIAATQGVPMTDQHWKIVEFARQDFEANKAAPNIRRITQAMGVETKALYSLFPKAPARTIAKIAGIPKPAGCL